MKYLLTLILLVLALPLMAQNSALRAGNKAYEKGKYGSAFDYYEKATQKGALQEGAYNAGSALYRLKDYEASSQAFLTSFDAGKEETNKKKQQLAQDALFNSGNALYQAGHKEEAKTAFRQVIMNNLSDKDAIHNLQIILKEEQQSKKDDEKQNQKQNQQQQDKQQQEQNQNNQEKEQQNQQNNQQQEQQDKQQQEQSEQEQDKQQAKEDQKKEEANNILQMAQEYKKDFPKNKNNSYRVEKDW